MAAPVPTPATKVGDMVANPSTGVDATVVQLFNGPDGVVNYVMTDQGDFILTKTVVGDTIQKLGETYKVVSVVTNATTGLVDKVNIRLSTLQDTDPTSVESVVTNGSTKLSNAATLNAPTGTVAAVIPPITTTGVIYEVSKGASGGNGGNAYGVTISFGILGDLTIAKLGSDGDDGSTGPTVNRTVTSSHGAISTTSYFNGISLGSIGGDGGKGGDSYGNIPAYAGGAAGNGGSLTLSNATGISTGQNYSHGIFGFSRSGTGGAGGSGYLWASGGSGGVARDGGSVSVFNAGIISTSGAESHGIYVLSVGGAAGNGGSSWGIVGQGGSGADGGNGGNVAVTNNGTIRTVGVGSHGILAQSIGGTGGNGGAAGGIVAFGGSASNGGFGRDVTIINQGSAIIETTSKNSVGVFGQSIGGSGGDSGAAGGIVALGSSGGSGNNSGMVTITNEAGSKITTLGQDSHGVFGQSVGGGGGNSSPTGGAVSIGGSASGGGNGNTVNISNSAVIGTGGTNAHGIFAQSIGGGGGSAGSGGGLVSLGGSGGAGGNGLVVAVTNLTLGSIYTTGIGSHAIFAQSIGGGGGAGGNSGGLVSIGGTGSGGGSGGTITVINSGILDTAQKDARGIFAQSIGGGGGAGGGSGGLVSLGGNGSTGSNASTVTITNHSNAGIFTKGQGSDAIFAQSIGGGGGAGASSGGLVALGGGGSGGGSGGSVIVTNAGFLSTTGVQARGIFAQSIGGGGGAGGFGGGLVAIGGSGSNASNAGDVTVTNTGGITTTLAKSTAIFAQSVGGGGGDGGSSGGMIAIGGSGASGGSAGEVAVTHGGQIFTHGEDAPGIFAQAVGGGGGNGGSSYSGSGSVGFALGGKGGPGGDGKRAAVKLDEFVRAGSLVPSLISTVGDRATGILAQSVGGGGGNGGNAYQSTIGTGVSLSVAIGGNGGSGGLGGTVNLTGKGDVITGGNNASAIVLQSVGGGGGNGGSTISGALSVGDGLAVSVALGGAGGNGGRGGIVTANVESAIMTDGRLSTGFLAQSVGGGGGNGGTTIAASGSIGLLGSAGIAVGVGGAGGSGGIGGNVDGILKGSVLTKGDQSDGIVIQSVGGGGGNGGLTVAAAAAVAGLGSGNITVGVGGSAGGGGTGGRVDARIESDVQTLKDGSDGVIIQSIGGGGGNSGLTVSAGLSGAGVGAGGVNVGVGGSGGSGGSGDIVLAEYSGILITGGHHATGLLAQSIGGGGGNSGGTIAASLNGAGTGSGSIAVGLGGSGGIAGDGGRSDTLTSVTLSSAGSVSTGGNYSAGIVAQSIGGGGGNGGYSVAASLSGAGVGSGAVSVGLGGKAGSGGDGKGVFARLASSVRTDGTDSTGILVQSVGGGGGNGGFNVSGALSGAGVGSGGIAVGLGGNGGAGGLGGNVDASSAGTIYTGLDRSAAFIAQSIGGGGGNGGFNVSGSLSGAGTGSGAISVGLGGNAGVGSHAGSILALTSGDIETYGNQSGGILAQSVGGGGGNGGFNVSAGASAAGTGSGAISVGLGGNGGGGGNGGLVDLTVNNSVYTEGNQSIGIIGQSIGGGGGNGGFNVSAAASGAGTGSGTVGVGLGGSGAGGGEGGAVKVTTTENIITKGFSSGGILAQSVGGGGGNGAFNVSVSGSGAGTGSGAASVGLGGTGAGGGNASTVLLNVSNNVTTTRKDSIGILAQSVGGGGGNGAFDVTAAGSGAGTGSGAVGVSLGGSAGSGGFGSGVTSSVVGDILTGGDNSTGLLVQSVGGGGGNGGFSVSAAISGAGTGSGAAAVGIGGSGGSGGLSGKVISAHLGAVTTAGKNATGIVVQSLGGGGGNGGLSVAGVISAAKTGSGGASVGIGGSGGGGGNSETVHNTVTGDILTAMSGSGGILAQSLGGGGGNGGLSVAGSISLAGTGSGAVSVGIGGSGGDGGNAAKVTNILTGNVFTAGSEGFGVVAQSIGGGGGNGGLSVSGAIGAAKSGAGALAFGLGGAGGGGGDAGEVNNTVAGYVQTTGANSTGVLAQSMGGGGGNGGLNVSGTITGAKTGSGGLAIGIGGFGGDGGDGNKVVNAVTGGIVTTGKNSDAILAQSLGGGGGNGGINVTGAINFTKEDGGALGVGIGGFGGNGGNAGDVTSTIATTVLNNQIGTTGDNSSAVVAQSLGGGGGNGGLNVTGVVNLTGKNGAAVGVGVGGFGGGAGNAGNVLLGVTGPVITEGLSSHGLLAQSIGGGGGNGGTNVSGSLAITTSSGGSGKTLAASIGVGGFGGGGGDAGNVGVTYAGTITAQPRVFVPLFTDPLTGVVTPAHYEFREGGGSHGIAAQSIGGGGGNGGINISGGIAYASGKGDAYGLVVGFGGFGGDGGDAGSVNVAATGQSISSYGAGHSAIFAQSLGGGGGNGALNVSGGVVSDSPLIVGVGGFGGDAGVAKNVVVNSATNLFASAADSKEQVSAGIMAQSIGGGGGNGALNISGGLALAKEGNVPSVTVGVGGFGGSGSISGAVTVNHAGNVTTAGKWIHGIMAQSIAGGGGNGGMNVSGQVNFADSNNSGGKTDLTIVAGIGGNAGTGANAGNVLVTHNGIVNTAGDHARGIIAQSIGGGGGTGGMNVTGVFAKKSSPINVGVGGSGSGGGHAGDVIVNRGSILTATGKITTAGESAYGIEASSIGGGGGDAGMNFIAGISLAGADETESGFAANFAIGGSGGEAGNGGNAAVNNFSDILTQLKGSHGILAQSIGGGGGNGNFNLAAAYAGKNKDNMGFNLAVGGAPGDGGVGGAVDVVQVGNIETMGANSFGILSQSIGGGGGNVGLDFSFTKQDGGKANISIGRKGGIGGTGANVTLSSKGNVITRGEGSFGMLAQSIGNGGGNSSSTTVGLETSGSDENPAKSAAVSIGLEGGVGGRAGNVTLDAEGSVITIGKNAHAIFAQSVGGGGGNGGSASTFGLSSAPTAALSIGGTGGTGGVGGIVDVTSSAGVRTSGEDSVGILAQSIGGGGGTGGMARTGGTSSKVDGVTVSVGGTGGAGMTSGNVTVTNSGIIITDGGGSHGVLAQSLGGGGGNSGLSINAVMMVAANGPKNRLAVSVGGTGGAGAISGDVVVANTGGIGTNKQDSVGIFAQSIGGGGGNAKNVIANTVSGADGGNNLSFAIGGSGGTGAAAGNVSVSNQLGLTAESGQIITLGNFSHGILAMSVGGGGGTGSTSYTTKRASTPGAETTTNSLAFNLGGAGGDGGTGGSVGVTNGGKITTYGFKAHGILAQSVGGGGGAGGMSLIGDLALGKKSGDTSTDKALAISVGGSGGTGNKSGNVTVTNDGSIEVFGVSAYGIYAQSVGGGGGDGGFAAVLSRNILVNPKTDLAKSLMNIGIGGSGGSGADGGDVLVANNGNITSRGDNSYGIFAQSVGGGGGNVGHSLSSPVWTAADLAFSSLLGARDASNGTGGTVTINSTGDISMLGKNSTAQFGQAVNGGGGNVDLFLDVSKNAVALGADGFELPDNGGDVDKVFALIKKGITLGGDLISSGAGAVVAATHVGDLYVSGKSSVASLIQSVGGGGGNASSEIVVNTNATVDLNLVLGGSSSSNTAGGAISSNRAGDVTATGAGAQGVGVQSIGGGGGNATVIVRKVPAPVTPTSAWEPVTPDSAWEPSAPPSAWEADPPTGGTANASALLGAVASFGSDGGDLNLQYAGDISTSGALAYGLIAQSIGGGGGKLTLEGLDSLDLALGSSGGSTGNGGDILLSNSGSIMTTGSRSNGVIIQSIGGGGGAAFTDLAAAKINLSLNAANSGNGGNISFDQHGDIIVTGEDSIAVFAQSLGGGGGLVDRAFAGTAGGAGISGEISLNLNGNVLAEGRNGIAVFAQSRAAGGQGDIDVELAAGKTIHAGINGVGLRLSGGADNRFTNRGNVMTADLLNGSAVIGEDGNDAIDNYGVFYGQFDLGAGTNTFVNKPQGLLVSGPELVLGISSNQLINEGILRPGGMQLAQVGNLAGSFTQTAQATAYSELDFGSEVLDAIHMTGAAVLGGVADVSLLNPQLVKPGHFQKSLFSADMGVTDAGMVLRTAPSVVIVYDVIYPNGLNAVLDYNVDFSPIGPGGPMDRNLREVGEYFNRIQDAGSSQALADTVVTLLYIPEFDEYRTAMSQLGPDFYGEHQAELLRSSQRFNDTLLDGGAFRFMEQDMLIWLNFQADSTNQDSYGDYKMFDHGSSNVSIGFQKLLKSNWTVGAGFSFENGKFVGYDGRWTAEGDTRHLGVMAKRCYGATELMGTLTYGWNNTDSERRGQVTDPFNAKASRDLEAFTAAGRVSHQFDQGKSYVRPALDAGLTRLIADDAIESNGGPTSLTLQRYYETHVWVRPSLKFGNLQTFGSGLKLHLYAEFGLQYYLTGSHTDAIAGFTGAPADVSPMAVPIALDSSAHGTFGVEMISSKNTSITLEYAKIVSANFDIDQWNLRLNVRF